ncbi:XK-related protein [Operophtera brumata]|uniref:XK-related protein n=1 Tax=Operophtera brumata TaxID=104452 RepID=A0A0L7KWZ8_OPEBR|nr:XK-related protein [Operophtera brumata]
MIETVNITPPPAMPAPRPGSIAVWAEKLMENAESFPTWISAPTRRKYCDHEVVQDEPDIPRRVPRSYMRGLEPQDATAALVHYMAWYTFFIARLISIACFINFFPVLAIILIFSHYQVMLLFLIVPQASTLRRSFYIFLAFIYLFCLMEFKIRFRHVRVWHVFWIIVCTVETIVFTGLWASISSSNIDDWWKEYVVKHVAITHNGGLLKRYIAVHATRLLTFYDLIRVSKEDQSDCKTIQISG